MITCVAMIAALAIGLFTGAVLMASYTQTKIARSQERMQRIVRHWQAKEAHMRAEVERLSRQWPQPADPPMDTWGG